MHHETSDSSPVPDGAPAGAIILACGLLSIVVVTHHPVVHGRGAAQLIHGIAEASTLDRLVHGTLIVFMFALSFGFSIFALRRGFGRLSTVAGLIAYLAGAAGVCAAALIDGFLIPALAVSKGNASGAAPADVLAILSAAAAAIQVLTAFGFLALSAGILLWSLALLPAPGALRYAGVLGIAAAVVTPIVILDAHLRVTPAIIAGALVPEALWYAVVGVLMVRRAL